MKKTEVQLGVIKLVGISVRTTNLLEASPESAKIPLTLAKYFKNHLNEKTMNRSKPGTTYCAYTDYESDEKGEYTYFVGEEVTSFEQLDPDFSSLIIPSSHYAKFESGPAKMPEVCIHSWVEIWAMQENDFGGKRSYITDFEIYDERAKDDKNTIMDIYIGIEKSNK